MERARMTGLPVIRRTCSFIARLYPMQSMTSTSAPHWANCSAAAGTLSSGFT